MRASTFQVTSPPSRRAGSRPDARRWGLMRYRTWPDTDIVRTRHGKLLISAPSQPGRRHADGHIGALKSGRTGPADHARARIVP